MIEAAWQVMTDDGAGFGSLLRACRRSAGLSQEELAARSGLSVRTISYLEQGRTRWPYQDSLRRLADALDLRDEPRSQFIAAASRRWNSGASTPPRSPGAQPHASVPIHAASGLAPRDQAVPRQLPAQIRRFSGRAAELAALDALLDEARGAAATVVISAISGTAGVGKTALAVHWANRVADRFPGGQLYANLRGYDPGSPVTAEEALAGFLRALGMPGQDIPADPDERAARYRSLLAGRRALIMLDNAGSTDQVRPLLPGAPGCLVVVTSRDGLAGLIARDGAERVDLDLLPLEDAVILLRSLIGSRAEDSPETMAALAAQCARLPLALRIAAELAAARPAVPLAELVRELADEQQRLDLFEAAGDGRTAIRAVFSWSYQNLSQPAARMFRLLGLHPGPDATACAAASLAGIALAQARRLLAELARAHLLTEQVPGRFGCHDLLRAYAIELAATTGSRPAAQAAQGRVLDYYLHTAAAADRLLYPQRRPITLAARRAGVTPEHLASHDEALVWLDAEQRGLVAAVALAASTGLDVHAWQLAYCLETYFYRRNHWQDWEGTQLAALAVACRLGDRDAQTLAHCGVANAQIQAGRPAAALSHLASALRLRHDAGDIYGEARVHQYTGRALGYLGRYRDALGHSRQFLRLAEAAGPQEQPLVADGLNQVGWHLAQLGRHQEALDCCERAVALGRQLGHKHGLAGALGSLAYVYQRLGRYGEAAEAYRRMVELLEELGDRWRKAEMLSYSGDAHHADGNLPSARQAWAEALAILDDQHHPDAESLRAKLHAADGVRRNTIDRPESRAGGAGWGTG